MSIGGDGVARIPVLDRTVVVFIPKSAPQDELKIKISKVEKSFLFGEIVQIIKPSSHRREPPCPVAFECGGCSWQQFSESEQIRQKELLLKELFQKFLPQVQYDLAPTVVSNQVFEYRNRIQVKHLHTDLGYFKSNSHEIVPITDCPIAEAPIRAKIAELSRTLKPTADLKKYEIKINQDGQVEHYDIGSFGEGLAFSQVNNYVNQLLVEQTLKQIQVLLPLDFSGLLTELYAGAGNFTFALAEIFKKMRIEAVELNHRLTHAASEIVKAKKLIKQVTFFTTKVETFAFHHPLSSEIILLDPPRSGCLPEVITRIAEKNPEHIAYISCHPTMLGRDVALLMKISPQYQIKHLQIFDMFPQTDHFETLCILSRKL
ncbi:MAG: class I SAM-dependent RNA methyltransferase [Moraxellaceae bacterium]|nr:class I SAM-dependent RNA methyltransferase [Pseudobdellovibrionaceae bacterium]